MPKPRRISDAPVVPAVRCDIELWVADEPQPGIVEARIYDANGQIWRFVDKAPIFTTESIRSIDEFPRVGSLRWRVIEDLGDRVLVETIETDSLDGTHLFEVPANAVVE